MRRLIEYFRPPAIRDPAALAAFLIGQSNYLTQRATYEFSRNTLGYFGQHFFADEGFMAQTRICRWEGFAAVLADALVLTEGLLRPAGIPADALRPGFVTLYGAALAAQPEPAHRAAGWSDLVDHLLQRLAGAAQAPPTPVREVSRHAARRIYDTLPIYSGNQPADRAGIEQAVHFGLVSVHDQLARRLAVADVARGLARG